MSEEYTEEVSSETTDSTTAIEESAPQAEPTNEAPEQKAQAVEQEEKPAPFHEHPRWKEMLEERNQYKDTATKMQQELSRIQQQMESMRQQAIPKKEEPAAKFIQDLEKVNPEYATYMKQLSEQAQVGKQIQQQFQQYQQQQFAQQAISHFDSLLTTSKIEDPIDKELYRSAVEAEVYRREMRGEKLGLKDLDGIFNSFHTKYSKALQDRERAITAKYVSAKKSDQAPAPTTGGAATAPVMKKFVGMDDPNLTKWLADQLRASKRQE